MKSKYAFGRFRVVVTQIAGILYQFEYFNSRTQQ